MAPNWRRRLYLALGLTIAATGPLDVAPAEAAPAAKTGNQAVGLATLLERAETESPRLAAVRSRLGAALARAGYIGTLEEPRLMAAVMNAVTLGGPSLTLARSLPLGGRLTLAEEAAKQEAEAARAELAAARARLLADVRQAYYEAVFLDRHLEIHHQVHEQLKSLLKIANARYSVGAGLQQDPLRAQLELAQLLRQLNVLERRLKIASSRLNTLANRPPDAPLELDAALPNPTPVPAESVLLARAEAQNPDLIALRAQIAATDMQLALIRKEQTSPDLDVGLQVGRSMPGDMLYAGGMVGLNLPWLVPGRFEKRIEEAEQTLEAGRARYRDRLNELRFRISELRAQLAESADQVALYRKGIQPVSVQALKSSLAAYQVGKVDFDTLIQNQNAVYEAQVGLTEALTEFNKAKAALEAEFGNAGVAAKERTEEKHAD